MVDANGHQRSSYAPVSDIDFRSAKKLKQNLDQTINVVTTSEAIARSGEVAKVSIPVSNETNYLSNFYTELNSCKACVSELDSSFPETFVSKSRNIPTISDLFDNK